MVYALGCWFSRPHTVYVSCVWPHVVNVLGCWRFRISETSHSMRIMRLTSHGKRIRVLTFQNFWQGAGGCPHPTLSVTLVGLFHAFVGLFYALVGLFYPLAASLSRISRPLLPISRPLLPTSKRGLFYALEGLYIRQQALTVMEKSQ